MPEIDKDAADVAAAEIAAEQRHVDHAYARLRAMEDRAKEVAAAAAYDQYQPGPLRDAIVNTGLERAARLNIGDEQLIFGRIDTVDGHVHHIGRVAVYDEAHEPLVIDWRAPVAEPFYRATPLEPLGVRRRRHISCRGQRVVHLEDEVFDADDDTRDLVVMGEGALFDAMRRERTGRMRDIVATIQREQDEVIRAPLEGVVLVQGGPGTGKTAVGLHRAAYLLYRYRDRLRRSGVLVVGPNPLFIRYIEQVLPALGESATMKTASELVPGIETTSTDDPDVARIKGDRRMAAVIRRAVSDIETGPSEASHVRYESRDLVLTANAGRHMAKLVRERLRGRHNDKRRDLREILVNYLFNQWRRRTNREFSDLVGGQERRAFVDAMSDDPAFEAMVEGMWPLMSAARLVRRLLTDPAVLRSAANGILSADDQRTLLRAGDGISEHDVALIDEATPLLGPLRRKRRRTPELDEEEKWGIERLLDDLEQFDPIVGAEREKIAQRLMNQRLALETDDRPEQERDRFGHVVIDEAQALSPMQWRMVARRCPTRSMTILGDLGQAGGAWMPSDWTEVLDLLAPKDSAVVELTLNYRTPAEIADLAERVLAEAAPAMRAPRAVRRTGESPRFRQATAPDRSRVALEAAREEAAKLQDGRVAILSIAAIVNEIRADLGFAGRDPRTLIDEPVTALTIDECRGLEFDSVVVVEPAAIVDAAPGGLRALYVALTRPTQRLVIVHADALPASIA